MQIYQVITMDVLFKGDFMSTTFSQDPDITEQEFQKWLQNTDITFFPRDAEYCPLGRFYQQKFADKEIRVALDSVLFPRETAALGFVWSRLPDWAISVVNYVDMYFNREFTTQDLLKYFTIGKVSS